MACPGEGILTNLAKALEDKTIKKFKYFRDFEDHVHDFVIENNNLIAKRKKVEKDIEDAKKKNENQIEAEVQNWIEQVDFVIQENTKINQECPHGWQRPYWQYRQGKKLAKRTPMIRDLIKECDFERVARLTELPGIKYHASRDFIDFESRKTKPKLLVEALQDGKHCLIGLHGMGGTGKTTLATQVGKQLEESKAFEKVIFVVASNPPDIDKIRGDIARPLGLDLETKVEAERSQHLWSRISKNEKKLLIILDDLWDEVNLTEIGIPSGLDHKNCYVLITTRYYRVCRAMRCTQIVDLQTLSDEDVLTLFLYHAKSGDNSSSNDLEGLAQDFVKECGGLPVAIVALASTLRNCHVGELNAALIALQKSNSFVDVDEDLTKVYSCLRLSYDYLHNENAQKLFLLCSVFPEDYEFSTDLILRLSIGSGIFEEVDGYCAARSQALTVKKILIESSLLQKVGEKECVKMHDLVREVAQWIAKEDIQVILDSRTTLKTNKRFVFWSTGDFPNRFDDTKLEMLLLWISGNVLLKDPNEFFAGMSRLKILFLFGEYDKKVPSPSLSKSLLSLHDIHTLILDGWKLGDISILKNIRTLVTIELKNCLIIELPRKFVELKKLRWLGLRKCEIQRNNPFEVISKCSQLEEIYFVGNYNAKDWKQEDEKEIEDEISHELQIFCIAKDRFERFANDDNGLLRCFSPKDIEYLIPDAMFRYLVRSAEVLELGKIGHAKWKNLSPDIIPSENGGKDNLIKLYLYDWDEIECLIDCSKDLCSNITFFSKLVELHLYEVDLKKLYLGTMPSSFLWKLQVLKLERCMKLQNIFFDENIKLPHLRVLILKGCPMFQPSIFQPSVVQNLKRLEELVVEDCEELRSLIAYDEGLEREMIIAFFPELKSLQIRRCGKLEMVLPLLLAGDLPKLKDLLIEDCVQLKCIFGENRDACQVSLQEIILPSLIYVSLTDVPNFISVFQNCKKRVPMPSVQVLKEDLKEKHENSKSSSAFSWAYGCCFLAQTKDTNISASNVILEHHTISQGSSKRMRQPFVLQNIKEMRLVGCSKLKSLFSVSIATTIMLEKLDIGDCEELKQLIRHEAEDDDHLKCTSIFPRLQSLETWRCHKLEFIFPSTLSGGLQNLKSISINDAEELKYVFGRYDDEERLSHEMENNESHIHLPALESLWLYQVPNMISVGIKKYQQKCPSLQVVEEAPQGSSKRMETLHSPVCLMRQPFILQNIKEMSLEECSKLKSLFSVSIAKTIMLEKLYIKYCEELKQLITHEAENDDHLKCTSIFPKLQSLEIWFCNKLEFIFPSTLSGGLQNLKSISIIGAEELKYVFGRYDDEECIPHEIENNESHIHLLALKSLRLGEVPNMISVGIKKYQQKYVSLQIVEEAPQMQDVTSEGAKESEVQEIVDIETPLTPIVSVAFQYFLNFHNLKAITIEGNQKLKTLFTISACRNLPQLSELSIDSCSELVCVVDEDGSNDNHHMNYSSIFSKLKELCIEDCNKLEFIFPLSFSGSLQKLKTLGIDGAAELKGIFKNESDELPIRLSTTLETLSFLGAPKIMNKILAKKYHLGFLSPQSLELGNLQESNGRSLLDLMACFQGMQLNVKVPEDLMMKIMMDVRTLTQLGVEDSKIEEVINLEGVVVEGAVWTLSLKEMWLKDHCELRHIWKGPKYTMVLPYLGWLKIRACKKLRVIFSVSIVASLPQLWLLNIEDCDELVDIIEESDEVALHQICFPNLKYLFIKRCNSLKCLFSISTCGMFPKLESLEIEEASEMEQVFIHKQGEVQNMTIMKEQVFPKLSDVTLTNLPRLITICQVIDCQNIRRFSVNECPKYKGTYHIEEWDSENQVTANASPDFAEGSMEAMATGVEVASSFSNEERVKEIEAKDPAPTLLDKQPKLTSASLHNYEETEKEGGRVVPNPTSKLPAPSSASSQILETRREVAGTASEPSSVTTTASCSNSKIMEETSIQIQAKDSNRAYGKQTSETWAAISQLRGTSLPELEDEDRTSESMMQLQQETKTTKASHKTNVPFHDNSIDAILNERAAEEGPTLLEDVVAAIMVADLKPRNSRNVTSSIVSPVQDHHAKRSKTEKEGVRVHASQLMATTSTNSEIIPNIEKESTTMKVKTDTLFTDPQEEGSQYTMSVERIQQENPTMEAKIDTSSSYYSQSGPSTMFYEESEEEVGFGKTLLALPATSTLSNKERVKEIEAKDHAPTLLEKQAQLRSTSLHNYEETEKEGGKVVPDPTSKLPAPSSASSQDLEDENKTSESLTQLQQETKTTKPSYKTNETFHDNSIDAILKERTTEEGPTSEDVVVATMVADLKPRNSWDITPSKSRSEMSMNVTSSIVEGTRYPPSTSRSKIKEGVRVHGSSQPPMATTSTDSEISKDTKDATVRHGPEPEKADIPIEDNTSLPNVIPSSHLQSQAEAATSSSPILEIGEIFQLVQLKDGEAALLAKALELYPQLKLSRGERTHPIIAFSYRVLVDILVMLATKTPSTMTESDRTTLDANLGAATFLGFDKDWVEVVRDKVFGIDRSDVLVAEEKISVMEEELEKCDSQLFDLLENRRNLVMKMAEFRKITSSKDKPFGI